MIFRLDQLAPVSLVHAGTITSLRNSGANCAERRDYAVFAGPGRTEASLGTRNQAAATIDAAIKSSTWTEHLCRMREAHRVSSRRGASSPRSLLYFFQTGDIENEKGNRTVTILIVAATTKPFPFDARKKRAARLCSDF